MSEDPCVGIDYGGIALHVSYATASGPAILPAAERVAEPAILFDPARNISSLGVGFPSILHSVGSGLSFLYADRSTSAEVLVRHHLADVHAHIARRAGGSPGATIFAASGALNHRKRKALLESAQAAGFTNVGLIDRPIAAVLGTRSEPDQTATYVVVC